MQYVYPMRRHYDKLGNPNRMVPAIGTAKNRDKAARMIRRYMGLNHAKNLAAEYHDGCEHWPRGFYLANHG